MKVAWIESIYSVNIIHNVYCAIFIQTTKQHLICDRETDLLKVIHNKMSIHDMLYALSPPTFCQIFRTV